MSYGNDFSGDLTSVRLTTWTPKHVGLSYIPVNKPRSQSSDFRHKEVFQCRMRRPSKRFSWNVCGSRGVYSPNTLEQVPPSLSPSPSLPLPLPSLTLPSFSLPSLPLPLEVGPLIAARGSGERFSSPSAPGRSPPAKRYLVNFRLKISPLVATIFRSFSEINHSVFAET